jgi:hypothetical protein
MGTNSIPETQVEQKQLERLAAQRELYSAAKTWYGWQITITVVLPVAFALLALVKESLSVPSALFGLLSFFVDSLFLESNIKNRKEKAAKIQELFDCDVLNLPCAPFRASDIQVEEVLNHYNAHVKISSNVEKLRDWYSPKIDKVPIYIARIICQRTNCWWDANLRKRFANLLRYIGFVSLIIVLAIGLMQGMGLSSILLIIAGLVPFYQYCNKQYSDNIEAISRFELLHSFSESLWDKAINKCVSEKDLTLESRRLQDEIFNHRANTPLVLNWIYNRFRSEDEQIMNTTAEKLIDEALLSKCF